MSRKKKNGRKKVSTEKIVLATVILNLIEALMQIIKTLIE